MFLYISRPCYLSTLFTTKWSLYTSLVVVAVIDGLFETFFRRLLGKCGII